MWEENTIMETQATLLPRSIPAVSDRAQFDLQYSNTPAPHEVTSNQRSPGSIPVRDMSLKAAKKIPTLVIVGTRVGRGRRFLASG